MAALLSTALDCHISVPVPQSEFSFSKFLARKPNRNYPQRTFTIACKLSGSLDVSDSEPTQEKTKQSFYEQLKPLSTTTLSDVKKDPNHELSSKPKSTWVNPTKPKRSALSLQRQKRSSNSYNPQIQDLRLFALKLNDSDSSESALLAALEDIPFPTTSENALLILKSLKPWQTTLLFFNWIKSQNSFPMETIFYNVTIKSLRAGKQFDLIEELANEMIDTGVELDNITYSTIITCAKRCNLFDKAVGWFERMYKTGLMPDEVTYSAILDVYAKLGKVEEALSLYERGRAAGWKPDPITFSVLAKMFGEAGDYDGIKYVLQELRSVGVQPNVVVYNTLLDALGRARKPGLARTLFEEMLDSGVNPNERTLTALIKIYSKARWGRDALQLWERMSLNGWPMDSILYNTLLNMCAVLGFEEEAEKLFQEMKRSGSRRCKPDTWTYTAMLNVYSSAGHADKATKLFDEMSDLGVDINVMGCTCLIQCLGKAQKIDDLVRVFGDSVNKGIEVDDRLCGSLLSVVSLCKEREDADKVIACLRRASPKLVSFIELAQEEGTNFETVKEVFKTIVGNTVTEARRPFCNCLIDIFRNRNFHERAHELLYLGTLYGLYPALHNKTTDEWCLDVRSLSVGAAHTALEEWMGALCKIIQRNEALPEVFSAKTGTGMHKYSQGLANAFSSHAKKLALPFRQSEEKAGQFVATREELVSWAQSRMLSTAHTG